MKKMIVMLAAVAMAACAQAVTVTWTMVDPSAKGVYMPLFDASYDDVLSEWESLYVGLLTERLILGETWDQQASSFQEGWVQTFTSNGDGSFSYQENSFGDDNYLLIIATYDDVNITAEGAFKAYIVGDTAEKSTFDLSSMTPIATGHIGVGLDNIPEPTSGLLILLGLAGLALKRKVA